MAQPLPTPASPETEIPDPFEGTSYRLIRRLARGGMGQVFLVEHRELGRECVAKLVHEKLARMQIMLAELPPADPNIYQDTAPPRPTSAFEEMPPEISPEISGSATRSFGSSATRKVSRDRRPASNSVRFTLGLAALLVAAALLAQALGHGFWGSNVNGNNRSTIVHSIN